MATKILISSNSKAIKSSDGNYLTPFIPVPIILDQFTLPTDLTELYIRQGGTLYRVDCSSK